METTVLGTRVSKEFAEKVNAYCKGNGLTPSELIKSLLEEELLSREPITSIYGKIDKNFKALAKLNLEVLYQTATGNFLLAHYILKDMLATFKDSIPAQHIETFNKLKEIADYSLATMKETEKALEEAGVPIKKTSEKP